jgi:DNA-binding transcriptional regulator YdaS (Cro superfamily)
MNLHDYLSQGRGRQKALARAIGAHAPDISRWADGSRPIPVPFGAPIEVATGGLVTRQEMFPDIWATIWPELAEEPKARRATDPAPEPAPARSGRKPPSRAQIMTASTDTPPIYTKKKPP